MIEANTEINHQPVLLEPAIQALNIGADGKDDGIYIDATYGRGGHSQAILDCLGDEGRLLAFDKDLEACEDARQALDQDQRFSVTHASFSEMVQLLNERHMEATVSGIIFDLGISSPQLRSGRGFSFNDNTSLDMRMDTTRGMTAAEWLNSASRSEIERVLKEFGEEKNAKKISATIESCRPLSTASQLAELVASMPHVAAKRHPATRTFLALRLFINNELEELAQALSYALSLLHSGGRLVVISFHSLEDRLVKHFIRDHSEPRRSPLGLPQDDDFSSVQLKKIGRSVAPSEQEIANNVRARSARMRVAERL